MLRSTQFVLLALVTLPSASQAFSTGVTGPRITLHKSSLYMCASPDPVEAVATKQSAARKAVALISALCIGGAAAPSASRARELSPEALRGSTSLVAWGSEAVKEEVNEKRSLTSVGIAMGAGAAGFGSVFILRKGGKKDQSPQEWAEKKQAEWKAQRPASTTQTPPPPKGDVPVKDFEAMLDEIREKSTISLERKLRADQ